ncbi:transient receptor potential cation channel subfamily M member 1-like [Amphiura filiformis]|uniref:transient receptor potential cation channel subfamily M member 1-like n=1 Tax=Amphiura filiformis TaxID=82378 RepID=UPI003B22115E
MAEEAENKKFLAHPCCTSKLDDDWFGEMDPSLNSWWFIPMALTVMLIPLYMVFKLDFFKIHFKENGKKLSWRRKLAAFRKAPVTKFWIYAISYVIFLLLYTYVLLFEFDQHLQALDIILFVWILTMVFEEIRVIVPEKNNGKWKKNLVTWKKNFCKWFKDKWNKMDIVMLTIAVLGFSLQWNDTTHEWARTLYAANSFIFFTRLLRSFAVNERLGPKMVMIQRMIVEMLLFLSILVVFLVSYGVASQALLYPNQKPSAKAIERVFFMPYFQIYGELFLEELVDGECEPEGTEMCPNQHWLIPVMLGVYLLLGNVLLLNLLIAIFSSVYEDIKCNSVQIWKYEFFSLVKEMKDRPVLPPPLIIIEHIYRMCKWLLRRFTKKDLSSSTEQDNGIDQADLTIFEQDCAARFMRERANEQMTGPSLAGLREGLDKLLQMNGVDQGQSPQKFKRSGSTGPQSPLKLEL